MSINLVYHKDDGGVSPFDLRAVAIATRANLRIACPYLSVSYLERLVNLASEWRLITDIAEWLMSTLIPDRLSTISFIQANQTRIRDHQGLHAKVIVGNNSAMIGSANFTISGITRRTEMAVHLDDAESVCEITQWFDSHWATSMVVHSSAINALIDHLPTPPDQTQRFAITPSGSVRYAALVTLEQPRDVRHYKNATGYYTGNGKEFCVIKGSKARSRAIPSFRYKSLREMLIRTRVLSREYDSEDFTFTSDYCFSSPSAAACIVSGQSRPGPSDWGSRTLKYQS